MSLSRASWVVVGAVAVLWGAACQSIAGITDLETNDSLFGGGGGTGGAGAAAGAGGSGGAAECTVPRGCEMGQVCVPGMPGSANECVACGEERQPPSCDGCPAWSSGPAGVCMAAGCTYTCTGADCSTDYDADPNQNDPVSNHTVINCAAGDCNGIEVTCRGPFDCEVNCTGGSCNDLTLECPIEGPCRLNCDATSCTGATMKCGGNACVCSGPASVAQETFGNSTCTATPCADQR